MFFKRMGYYAHAVLPCRDELQGTSGVQGGLCVYRDKEQIHSYSSA